MVRISTSARVRFYNSHEKGIEELKKSYKKKFNPHHWIFCIGIKKLEG